MKKRSYTIKQGEYLIDILKAIPTNSVIRKNITDIGATTLEIEFNRNSIIILPNLPVIYSKEEKFKNSIKNIEVLGVHGDRTNLQIIDFLSKESSKSKKFLVTPESFYKLIECFKHLGIDYRNDYFLLFDECDKISKDIDYRKTISVPLDEFFKFKNKSLISATALVPSDPRFETEGFEFVNINPHKDFVVTQDIKIYKTNNSMDAFNYLIKQDVTEKNYFIFCNSIRAIAHLVNSNGIHENTSIFCSETSAESLKQSKVKGVYHKLKDDCFSKYNFLTSRFFAALDIDFDKDVEIYIITDLGIADHSIIDPETDAVQIIGRFRNKSIKKNVKVLLTEEPEILALSKTDCLTLIDKYEFCYNDIINFGKTLPSGDDKRLVKEITNRLDFNHFMSYNGQRNHFKVDNYVYRHKINKHYQNFDNIINAYKDLTVGETEQKRFDIKYIGTQWSNLDSAKAKLLTSMGQKLSTTIMEVVTILDACKEESTDEIFDTEQLIEDIKRMQPEIFLAYQIVDKDTLLLIEKKIELTREITRAHINSLGSNLSFLSDLKVEFLLGEKLTTLEIKARFQSLITKHKLSFKATKANLDKYIDFKRVALNKDSNGYKVRSYKNNF